MTLIQESATKKNKISRKPKGASKNMYFSEVQDKAIVAFQQTESVVEKNKIYLSEIHPAFVKLVENLISIYKFSSTNDIELKNDCISFLFETLGKFDITRGSRSFSYFNVVAKRWLIIKTKSKNQITKRQVSMDDPDSLTTHESFLIDQADVFHQDEDFEEIDPIASYTDMLDQIDKDVKNPIEKNVINSIRNLYANIDDIEFFNKSAVLVYMRESSGTSSKQLTAAMQNIKKIYRKHKKEKINE